MERVNGGVEIVHLDFDDLAFGDDEWIDGAVDGGVGVAYSGRDGCVECWHFLVHIGDVVEVCSAGLSVLISEF